MLSISELLESDAEKESIITADNLIPDNTHQIFR